LPAKHYVEVKFIFPTPNKKPLKLIQQVLLSVSKKGDLILDPFVGSGTTAVVAKALDRN